MTGEPEAGLSNVTIAGGSETGWTNVTMAAWPEAGLPQTG
jgi:hypothetical protein